MMIIQITPIGKYNTSLKNIKQSDPVTVIDHLDGFSVDATSPVLTAINSQTDQSRTVHCEYIPNTEIKNNYPKLQIKFDINNWFWQNNIASIQPRLNLNKNITKFLCSFNNSGHVGRILLTSALNSYGYFDPEVCSKIFVYEPANVLGALNDLVGPQAEFYKMFFLQNNTDKFASTQYKFGSTPGRDHGQNQQALLPHIDTSFLHLVSETMATSYYPFVTEKFFYSVAAGSLFLTYAQPGWHDHVSQWLGFRQYNKIFDYGFDSIPNPVTRLIALMDMLYKFSKLSPDQWKDLYTIEQDTIDYNYEHFASGRYLSHLHTKIVQQQGPTELGAKILQKIK